MAQKDAQRHRASPTLGTVDLKDLVPFEGVFGPLKNQAEFEQAYVDAELGTVCWPNGADLDPVVLYARLSGRRIPYQMHEAETRR